MPQCADLHRRDSQPARLASRVRIRSGSGSGASSRGASAEDGSSQSSSMPASLAAGAIDPRRCRVLTFVDSTLATNFLMRRPSISINLNINFVTERTFNVNAKWCIFHLPAFQLGFFLR